MLIHWIILLMEAGGVYSCTACLLGYSKRRILVLPTLEALLIFSKRALSNLTQSHIPNIPSSWVVCVRQNIFDSLDCACARTIQSFLTSSTFLIQCLLIFTASTSLFLHQNSLMYTTSLKRDAEANYKEWFTLCRGKSFWRGHCGL